LIGVRNRLWVLGNIYFCLFRNDLSGKGKKIYLEKIAGRFILRHSVIKNLLTLDTRSFAVGQLIA
jgi:hypothetical protein